MKVQLIRNATLKIEYAGKTILLDPMFAPKGAFDGFVSQNRNPLVDLTVSPEDILVDVEMVLVTHTHPDHFDPLAIEALDKNLPLFCQPVDADVMKEHGFVNSAPIEENTVWEGITISRTDGKHGSGKMLEFTGVVSGFVLQADNEPTLYVIGDSIWVAEVEEALNTFKPEVIVTNSGGAEMPALAPGHILMQESETLKVKTTLPDAKVVAVHMEALDHCKTNRTSLKEEAEKANVEILIPQDGEVLEF